MASKSTGTRVLVVDDDRQERLNLVDMISGMGYVAETAEDGQEALEKIGAAPVDVILTDLMMPRMDGFQLLRTMLDRGDLTPAIVLTGFGSIDQAVSIVHDLRAFWFLEKPAQLAVLATLLERAISHQGLVKETARLQRQLSYQGFLADMVGTSGPMQQIFSLIQQVAPSSASVLISGESGTGKELVAAAIHKLSPRAGKPFVAVNCAALPESLIESELFGHEKGSFTGALGRHPGCFEQAHTGTLLLDEIGEMPLPMQAKLLRVLEDSRVRRLGGTAEIPVDVRVLAATNRPLDESLKGRFLREDLYYRLNVFQIALPPLRHRKEDIAGIAEVIIRDLNRKHECHIAEIHPATLERLLNYSWPGNVRELRNILERAVIVAVEGAILPSHLPRTFGVPPAQQHPQPLPPAPAEDGLYLEAGKALSTVEKAYIELTLKSTDNNKKRTAQILGISIRTLHNRLAEFAAENSPADDIGSESIGAGQ
jgi:DNA-binding NtrC family response regulator